MLKPDQAMYLRELIARHAHHQFRAGGLERRQDPVERARVQAAADASTRALCAALAALTLEETTNELS